MEPQHRVASARITPGELIPTDDRPIPYHRELSKLQEAVRDRPSISWRWVLVGTIATSTSMRANVPVRGIAYLAIVDDAVLWIANPGSHAWSWYGWTTRPHLAPRPSGSQGVFKQRPKRITVTLSDRVRFIAEDAGDVRQAPVAYHEAASFMTWATGT